jgi:hypothetical protein
MLVSKKGLSVCLCIGIILIPFIGSGDLLARKKKSSSIEIVHSPIKYFVPGSRIMVSAEVTDPTGIMLVRCYFKAEGAADFVFVDMTSHSDEYDGILPSPSPNTNRIEYLILAVNNKKVVYKTQSFFIEKSDKEKPAWQNVDSSQQITVKTELPTPPETVVGFADDIAVDVVESALRFGLVAGGIYAAVGLTTPAGATAGGTVAASGTAAGGISTGTIALGVAGAAAVAGGVALAVGSKKLTEESLPGTYSVSGTHNNCSLNGTVTFYDNGTLSYSFTSVPTSCFTSQPRTGDGWWTLVNDTITIADNVEGHIIYGTVSGNKKRFTASCSDGSCSYTFTRQ